MDKIIHEKQRRECWMTAYSAVAGAFNCYDAKTAAIWADGALAAFDERFKETDLITN